MLGLEHLEVLLDEREIVGPGALDRVAHRSQRIEVGEIVAELPGARLGEPLAALAGLGRAVIACAAGLQRVEDLVERVLPDAALPLGSDLEPARRALDLARLLEHLLEVGHPELLVEEAVLLAEMLHPAQRLLDVTAGLEQQVAEDLHELLAELEILGSRALPFRVVELHGVHPRSCGLSRPRARSACS